MARPLLADWDNTEEAMRQRFTLRREQSLGSSDAVIAANVLPPVRKPSAMYSGINVTVHDVVNDGDQNGERGRGDGVLPLNLAIAAMCILPTGRGSVCRYCFQPIHDWQIGNA